MLDDNKKFDYVENLVIDLLLDYQLCNYPVDVFRIAKILNIRVVKKSRAMFDILNIKLDDIKDGITVVEKGLFNKYAIIYNDSNYSVRNRFIIAHEIGHILLKHTKPLSKQDEILANHFARSLLIHPCVAMITKTQDESVLINKCWISKDVAKNIIKATKSFINMTKEKNGIIKFTPNEKLFIKELIKNNCLEYDNNNKRYLFK